MTCHEEQSLLDKTFLLVGNHVQDFLENFSNMAKNLVASSFAFNFVLGHSQAGL